MTASLTSEQMRSFGKEGYLVLPQAVPDHLVSGARRAIAARIAQEPPPADHRGPHFYFLSDLEDPLLATLYESPAHALARSLIAPGTFDRPDHIQIALNFPPFPHRPGGPHIDGLNPPEEDGRPVTFTVLAGIFLTDQSRSDAGNLWVWPGSHFAVAGYLRQNGPDVLSSCAPYPPVPLADPAQVTGRAGDVLIAHYMLGHNIGGNVSQEVREVLYFRLRRTGHRRQWRDAVQNALLEFEPVRAAMQSAE